MLYISQKAGKTVGSTVRFPGFKTLCLYGSNINFTYSAFSSFAVKHEKCKKAVMKINSIKVYRAVIINHKSLTQEEQRLCQVVLLVVLVDLAISMATFPCLILQIKLHL